MINDAEVSAPNVMCSDFGDTDRVTIYNVTKKNFI